MQSFGHPREDRIQRADEVLRILLAETQGRLYLEYIAMDTTGGRNDVVVLQQPVELEIHVHVGI